MTNEQYYNLMLIKARRPNDTTLRAVVESEFRQLLQTWEQSSFHPWFLEKTSSGLVTVADTETVTLPTDYLILVEDTKVWAIDSEDARTLLKRRWHEDIEEFYVEEEAGLPEVYDIFSGSIFLGPIPDAVYTIRMKYYQKSTAPAVDSQVEATNLWLLNAEEFAVSSVAQRLCENYTKDMDRARDLGNRVAQIRAEMFKYNEARKHVDMDYAIER